MTLMQSVAVDSGLFIRLDGTTVTTASIPFAEGLSVADFKTINMGTGGLINVRGNSGVFSVDINGLSDFFLSQGSFYVELPSTGVFSVTMGSAALTINGTSDASIFSTNLNVTQTNTSAFVVETTGGTDIFQVDTSTPLINLFAKTNITKTDANAFIVEQAGGTDVFKVNTTTPGVTISTLTGILKGTTGLVSVATAGVDYLAAVAGSDTNFQYNNAGALGGSTFFNYATGNIPTIGDGNAQTTSIGTATVSNATPAVVTKASHGLAINDRVIFTTTGALPAPLHPDAGTPVHDGVSEYYYIISSGFTANSFQISLTRGGAAINTTTAGSGTHTLYKYVNYQLNFDSTKDALVEWRNELDANQWTLSVRRSDDTYFQYPGYAARFLVNATQVTDYESPVAFSAFINAGANTSELYGFWGGIYDTGSAAKNITAQGIGILCYNYLAGSNARTIADIVGGDFTTEMGSNITGTNAIGGRFQGIVAASSATYTNTYALYVKPSGASGATVTNDYGIRLEAFSCATNSYPIFLNSAGAINFRAGTQAIWSSAASTLDLTSTTTYNFKIGANPANGTAGTTLATLTSNSGWQQSFSAAYGVAATWKGALFSATNTTATASGAGTGVSIALTTAQTNGTHNLLTMAHSSTGQTSGQIRGGFFSISSTASETPGVVGYSIGLGRGTTGTAQSGANSQMDGFIMHMASSTTGGTGFGIRMERAATYPAAMVAFQSFGDITTLDDNLWDIGKTALRFKTLFLDTALDMLDADIVTDTTTGMKIGTGTTQKIGFWNATPIVRPSAFTQTYSTASKTHAAVTSAAVATTAATNITPFGYTTAAQADAIPVAINAVAADLLNLKQVVNSIIDDLQAVGLLA